MPRYYHEHSYHKQTRFIKKVRVIFAFILLVGLLVGAFVGVDAYRSNHAAQVASAPTQQVTSVYSPKTKIFTTQYFQFQAGTTWSSIASETTDTVFTYRSSRRGLTEQDLTIMINSRTPPKDFGRVLPVDVGADQTITPGNVSALCGKTLPATAPKVTQQVTIDGVSFLCDYDATDYIAIVGKRGSTAPLLLTRPNGTKASYTIIYRNSSATPDDQAIREILSSFQTR